MSLQAEPGAQPRRILVLVFLDGGPSHLDMWDMKPTAPAEIRGEFKPVASACRACRCASICPRFATTGAPGHSDPFGSSQCEQLARCGRLHGDLAESTGARFASAPADRPPGDRLGDRPSPAADKGGGAPSVDAIYTQPRGPAALPARVSSAAGSGGKSSALCAEGPEHTSSPCLSCRCLRVWGVTGWRLVGSSSRSSGSPPPGWGATAVSETSIGSSHGRWKLLTSTAAQGDCAIHREDPRTRDRCAATSTARASCLRDGWWKREPAS